jgi:protein TonB
LHVAVLVSFSPQPVPARIAIHVGSTALSFRAPGTALERSAAPASPTTAAPVQQKTTEPALQEALSASGTPSADTEASKAVEGSGQGSAGAETPAGSGSDSTVGQYLERLREAVDGHKNYPYAARTRGQQGTVLLAFRLDGQGSLAEEPRVLSSSGYPRLDAAAVAAVKGSSPFVPPPDAARPWEFRVPVQFVVR